MTIMRLSPCLLREAQQADSSDIANSREFAENEAETDLQGPICKTE